MKKDQLKIPKNTQGKNDRINSKKDQPKVSKTPYKSQSKDSNPHDSDISTQNKSNKSKNYESKESTHHEYNESNFHEHKRLYRSKKDKIIAGVCGGIAEYFNIDPVWIRLLAVLLIFADGVGVIVYVLAWILMPVNPIQNNEKDTIAEETVKTAINRAKVDLKTHNEMYQNNCTTKICNHKKNSTVIFGLIIILIGTGIILHNLFSWFSFKYMVPVGLIVFGLILVRKGIYGPLRK